MGEVSRCSASAPVRRAAIAAAGAAASARAHSSSPARSNAAREDSLDWEFGAPPAERTCRSTASPRAASSARVAYARRPSRYTSIVCRDVACYVLMGRDGNERRSTLRLYTSFLGGVFFGAAGAARRARDVAIFVNEIQKLIV